MLDTLKRLAFGIVLLLLSAAVLLYSDRGSRHAAARKQASSSVIRVALVQHASVEALEQGADGMLAALEERGYVDGQRVRIQRYNAEGDIGTANAIGKEVAGGSFDLLLSVSTVSLQTVANANQMGARTPHAFGLVTDPYAAGVGIDASNHLSHPPYMAGSGCLQPVERILQTAREMRPELKSVGLVWNAAEVNSLVQTKLARQLCGEMGLQLIEATADNSSAVLEAANSVIARGAECIWISGDVTVAVARDQVIAACRRARIPVFTALPPDTPNGSLFDMGANYFRIGEHIGHIAADILEGQDPATMSIDNFVPVVFVYNETVLEGLRDRWTIPETLRKQADGFVTATATNLPNLKGPAKSALQPKPGRTYKVGLAYFAPDAAADLCRQGIVDGLQKLGFEEGRNLEIRLVHAQGEIANIPAMLQNFDASDVDLILPMSTPVITAACGVVKNKPVVFTFCSDPVAAGAGESFTNHLPFVTGVGSFPPVQDMVDAIRLILPEAKSVGTIYNGSEANSVKVVAVARGLFEKAGMELEEVTVATSAEVLEAGQALASRGVDAIYIQGDNTVLQGFDAVIRVTGSANIPLFVDDPISAKRGALACVGLGFYRPGFAAATMVAKVLCGDEPARIPMENVSEKTVWLNSELAGKLGLTLPQELIAQQTPAR